jgi:hypothetical protein
MNSPKEARNSKNRNKSLVNRGYSEAPDNAHFERVGDEGAAESAEVGIGHVVGHGQNAHLRLSLSLKSNTADVACQPWTSGTQDSKTYLRNLQS